MNEQYLIGVDLGSTAVKAGLFDSQGRKIATHTQEHQLLTPCDLAVEQCPEVYWEAFKACIAGIMEKSGVDKESVLAISLSAQGETMVFLDENMEPLYNFIVWMDTRPQEEAGVIGSWFSAEEVLQKTGQGPITSLYPACKVLWFQRHYPDRFARTRKILLLDDYIFYRMGGGFYSEGSNWCTSYMWDINTRTYWPEMLERLNLTPEMLPQTVETATPIGTLLPEAAQELGLTPKVKLIMGGLDQSCGTIGVGNVKPGIFSESTGAALVVCSMTKSIVLDRGGELPCFYGVIPDLYMLHAGGKGGIILRWLRDTLCTRELEIEQAGGDNAYNQMDALAAPIPAGSDGLVVLPYFGGAGAPNTDQYAKGTIYGLSLQHTRAHLIRAFMEATAINIYCMVEYCERVTGKPVAEIRSLGGGARSPLWCQIKADVLGRPVVTMKNTQDAACLGAAIIAGVGAGLWDSIAETASRLVEIEHVYTPNPANRQAYDRQIRRYKLLTGCIAGKTEELS